MKNSRIWFIGDHMYTDDEAEACLDETILELRKLYKHTVEQVEMIRDILKEISFTDDETFQTKYNVFIELSEKLSFSSILMEELNDYFRNHGF